MPNTPATAEPEGMTEQQVLDEIEKTRASMRAAKQRASNAKAVLMKVGAAGKATGTYTERVRAHRAAKTAEASIHPPKSQGRSLTTMEQRQRAADAKRGQAVKRLPSVQDLSEQGFEIEVKAGTFRVAKTLANAMLAIEVTGFICSFNVFTGKYIVETAKGPGELSDQLVTMIRQQMLNEYGFDPTKAHIRDAIEGMCLDRQYNPVTDWLGGLVWDGVRRLDSWLTRYCGAADTVLNRAIGRKVLCAMVRRARRPGCKFDHVMVLEGPEDIGKSTVVRILGSGPGEAYFSDATILDVKDKEQQELTKGVWAYEIGELTGIRKADVERVKQFISRQSDKARAAYAHYVVDQHRQCVFIGTTNDQEYLMSQNGNRRWWPVACGDAIDLDALRKDRDQLFAEAMAVEPGEALFISAELFPDLRELHEVRRIKHPWEDELAAIEDDRTWVQRYEVEGGVELRILTRTIFHEVLGRPRGLATDADNKRLSQIMQRLGWTKSPKTIRVRHQGSAMGYTKLLPLIAGRSGMSL
jgi:hypothetical protein